MPVKTKKRNKAQSKPSSTPLQIRQKKTSEGDVTQIRLTRQVTVAATEGFLTFWHNGQELRIGPLTSLQAERLSEDLAYEAMAGVAKVRAKIREKVQRKLKAS